MNGARFLGHVGESGSLEAGKRADIVLLNANPLVDIGATRQIDAVVLAGRLLRRGDLDDLLAQAARRVAQLSAPAP